MQLNKIEIFICEMVWGSVPTDVDYVRNSSLFKEGQSKFNKNEYRRWFESESWKDIKGYEGQYQCSSHGRVRSLDREYINSRGETKPIKGKVLKEGKDKDGYSQVVLCVNNIRNSSRTHQLIYETFIGERSMIINHINGNVRDNAYWNLEQVTNRENMAHYYSKIKGNKKPIGVEKRGNKYRAKTQYKGKSFHIGTYLTEQEAIQAYNTFVKSHDNSTKYIH